MDSFESVEPTPFERLNHRLVETEARLRLANEELFYLTAYVRQMETKFNIPEKQRYKLQK